MIGRDTCRHEWLDEGLNWDHGMAISGRSTQFEQVYWSVYVRVREAFPINEVPDEVLQRLNLLRRDVVSAEFNLRTLINHVSDLRSEEEPA